MEPQIKKKGKNLRNSARSVFFGIFLLIICFVSLTSTACDELEKPKTEPYYAETAPPPKQEFRWSNGKTPKSFDPALAAAPPETDVARAIYEGLTDTHSKNLEPIPAIALSWKSEENNKVWTFELRRDAKWSNGETVKAEDFVRSWKRLKAIGKDVSHPDLLSNIVGLELPAEEKTTPVGSNDDGEPADLLESPATEVSGFTKSSQAKKPKKDQLPNLAPAQDVRKTGVTANSEKLITDQKSDKDTEELIKADEIFGAEAISEFTLRVTLKRPDKDLPALVAHPLFRPVYPESNFEKLNADIVTNGAFRITSVGQDGVTLDRSDAFWNKENVKLERVRFIPKGNAEQALEAYRSGELDAITNAEFEPLALKLLMPYEDFKRTTHSALNFYEFNKKNKPFDDKKIREALAISIERERLTDDDMDGSTRPALGFQPISENQQAKLTQDLTKGKQLLDEAGFPNGENFPKIRLVINRNNVQQRIARSVAKMWKQNLNIETEIVVKETGELDSAIKSGEFDIVRRGVVLPTSDETVNMLAIFSANSSKNSQELYKLESDSYDRGKSTKKPDSSANSVDSKIKSDSKSGSSKVEKESEANEENVLILTEDQAIAELFAIPLYFPTSYSLVKPYVIGFEINSLDASSLIEVSIDNYWQPKFNHKQS